MIKISDPYIGGEEMEAVNEVLRSGTLARGPKIKEFEEAFARYAGTDYAIATSSGTTALHAAMLAHGITSGEVIVPSFSFVASANAVIYAGAKPVFADVSEEDFNINTDLIENLITKNTKAIMPVHLYGQMCDMDEIRKLCESYDIVLIEDACQAHGAEYKGRKAGSFGTGCFSFYATKNMTTGEGGMITTNDERIAEKSRMIISHGSIKAYDNKSLGYNFRMTEAQAAMGITQLSRIDELTRKRQENAQKMTKLLKSVKTPKIMPGRTHVFHQYTIKTDKRDKIIDKFKENGIGYGVYYPKPIHKQDFYIDMGYKGVLPVSEKLSEEVLSIPIHPKVTEDEIEKIASCITEALE